MRTVGGAAAALRTVTDAVAHDLKSPVTWIRGRLEVALSNGDDSSWREPVAEAIEGLDRMSQVLNTTLDLAEAAGGALLLEHVKIDVSALVEQLMDLYQPAFAEHEHEIVLQVSDRVTIEGDIAMLRRVIVNLLDNELAHLPDGRRIEFRVNADGSRARLKIDDNGPGFPPDIQGRELDRFVKGRQSSGHGLGLAFVDAVVRAHGGTTQVSNRSGGGASIAVFLPLRASVAQR